MNPIFIEEEKNVYRLKIPFEDVYTSVFLITMKSGNFLVDCASTDKDVDCFIIPALNELKISLATVKYLILTHRHPDHSGGLDRLLALNPELKVIDFAGFVLDTIKTQALAGHTKDCIGVLIKNKTLIVGDALQGDGVGKFIRNVHDEKAYLQMLNFIESQKHIRALLFSHAYKPWNKDKAVKRRNILKCINVCKKQPD